VTARISRPGAASAARELAEAVIRQQATYRDPSTGRYRCAVTEGGLAVILAAMDSYAEEVAAVRVYDRARARRLAAAEASAAEHSRRAVAGQAVAS
jgi:hypothetical protein